MVSEVRDIQRNHSVTKDFVLIRAVTEADAGELREIYAPYVERTAISFETEVPDEEEFRRRIRETLKRYPYLAAVRDGEILGYTCTHPFVGRAAYDWSAETTIYLKQGRTRQGIGGRLYQALERISAAQNITNLNACIGLPEQDDEYLNGNSVQFHAHMGYSMVGKFHNSGYKFGRWYHMVWMEKLIAEHRKRQPAVIPFPELAPEILKACMEEPVDERKAGIQKKD